MAFGTAHADRDGRAIMRRAVGRLAPRLTDLADRLLAEIVVGECWDRPAELRDDLWQVCHVGLGHGVATILDPDRGRADLEWAERLGRRRAEQGQPLDQLLRSYRLAGRVFWEAVVDIVSEDDPAHVPVLVRQATRTWHTIDELSSAAAAAYHRTEYDLLRSSEERTAAVVDALLEGRGTEGALLTTAAEALGLPVRGRYAVVVIGVPLPPEPPEPPDGEGGGLRFFWRLRADTRVAVVALGPATLDDLTETLRPYVAGHAGVSAVVDGLAELGTARHQAELAIRTCCSSEPEIALLDRRLPDALIVSEPRLAGRLGRIRLGPLLELDAAYRDVLLDTFATWLECDGSAAAAAPLLYCHHNTVLNRLRRLERLTGCALTRPRDLVELVLALSAVRLLPLA
ncbi:PucR family transcriptional regulator [Actinomadura barringtoniae]|uniref:PucR family transcriptional regulator n=1 Tax=Actinomadura barringtoniae TaxID=1427535 RepID=UPI0027DAD2D8|nr:helix-turn-helix domain-containing protein [Actinomadura barringtoniae]